MHFSIFKIEHTPLLGEKAQPAHAVRWWLLFLLSSVGLSQAALSRCIRYCSPTQGWIWNDWGPIAQSAKAVYGWTDGTIALLANWVRVTLTFAFMASHTCRVPSASSSP